MNISLNKKRFDSHITYDWYKYIVIALGIILLFTYFYAGTVKTLTDVEEVQVLTYCYRYDEDSLEALSNDALAAIGSEVNPELKNVEFMSFSYQNDAVAYADQTRLAAELLDMNGDVFILPDISEYRYENPDPFDDREEYRWAFTKNYAYSNQAICGRKTFIPIDEMIALEKASGNAERVARATKLEQILAGYDEDEVFKSYANYFLDHAYEEPEYYDVDANGNPIEKKWGIRLSVLDSSKLDRLFIGDGDQEFILSVRINSDNITDSVAFICWLFENFA